MTHKPFASPLRRGTSLVEMMLIVSTLGGLMLITVRVFHLATQVNEAAVSTATHLRLAASLEDRMRSDIAKASVVTSAPNEIRLTLSDSTVVRYQLVKPNIVERQLVTLSGDQEQAVPKQRWPLAMRLQMRVETIEHESKMLVKVRMRRAADDTTSIRLREIEVSEVTHGA